ncbi:MAG: SPOR domain-containing protein [Ramlibacter sp.]
MAFFKFRKAGDDTAAAAPAESVEVMRRRARHRLIGAAVLVLIGVVGFPLLFDTQPRPVQVDIPIDIPDRAKAKPLPASPAAPVVAAPAVSGPVTAPVAPAPPAPPPKVAQAEGLDAREEIVPAKPAPKPAAVASGPVAAKPEPKPAPPSKTDDGARAKALLEGKAAPVAAPAVSAANGERYVVQVGAFADADKARETRLKVERAGLKTYTHVAETREGRRIRVRVGPFATRAEADRAAEKIKGLDLPAAILTL